MKWIVFLILFSGCAAMTQAIVPRGFTDRAYEFADYPFVAFKYCSKYKLFMPHRTKFCKEWAEDKIDISKPEGFARFKEAKFLLLNERVYFVE